ncbi:hypothetical protein F0U61_12835 [Archangium violaceum]|uniref:hypothetical protein n=1 Tax=Archangium violaceum TaxID=83451 RepID=UPI002B2A879F|nr:hypothetical protein F0U61_12835 [Archangium violaceum]
MNDRLPWDVHPGLTLDRLQIIARLLADIRERVSLHLEPEEGDLHFGMWVAGTMAHARTAYQLTRMVFSGDYSWLSIVDGSMQFTFAIDRVPVRVFKGDPEKPSRSAQKKSPREAMIQLALFEMKEMGGGDLDWQWRIAVEPEPTGEVFRITLVQVNVTAGVVNVRNLFVIPFRDTARALTDVASTRHDGVELPPPPIGELTDAEETGTDATTEPPTGDDKKGHGTDG